MNKIIWSFIIPFFNSVHLHYYHLMFVTSSPQRHQVSGSLWVQYPGLNNTSVLWMLTAGSPAARPAVVTSDIYLDELNTKSHKKNKRSCFHKPSCFYFIVLLTKKLQNLFLFVDLRRVIVMFFHLDGNLFNINNLKSFPLLICEDGADVDKETV